MTLHELFTNHPWIAWSFVAVIAAEIVVVIVLAVQLFRKTKPRRDAGH